MEIDFDSFYSRNYAFFVNFASKHLGKYSIRSTDAEEIVSQVMFKFCRSDTFNTFKGTETNLRTYICTGIVNAIYSHLESRKHREASATVPLEFNEDGIYCAIENSEHDYTKLLTLIQARLNKDEVSVFVLKCSGMTYEEIQDLLGIKEQRLRYLLRNIREHLKEITSLFF